MTAEESGTMEFTHFDEQGNAVMVDVSKKEVTDREAKAKGTISMSKECFQKITDRKIKKGDVLGAAQIAGIMGAKKTAELIPLCHMLPLTNVEVTFEPDPSRHQITVYCKVKTAGKTGVEMEALTGVQIALLTIYDMCKAVDKTMIFKDIHLVSKTGGKSGDYQWEP